MNLWEAGLPHESTLTHTLLGSKAECTYLPFTGL